MTLKDLLEHVDGREIISITVTDYRRGRDFTDVPIYKGAEKNLKESDTLHVSWSGTAIPASDILNGEIIGVSVYADIGNDTRIDGLVFNPRTGTTDIRLNICLLINVLAEGSPFPKP